MPILFPARHFPPILEFHRFVKKFRGEFFISSGVDMHFFGRFRATIIRRFQNRFERRVMRSELFEDKENRVNVVKHENGVIHSNFIEYGKCFKKG